MLGMTFNLCHLGNDNCRDDGYIKGIRQCYSCFEHFCGYHYSTHDLDSCYVEHSHPIQFLKMKKGIIPPFPAIKYIINGVEYWGRYNL
jgi:hypothetical protein